MRRRSYKIENVEPDFTEADREATKQWIASLPEAPDEEAIVIHPPVRRRLIAEDKR